MLIRRNNDHVVIFSDPRPIKALTIPIYLLNMEGISDTQILPRDLAWTPMESEMNLQNLLETLML